MEKLNIGCGADYKDGYWNIDASEHVKADLCANITEGLYMKDDSIDEIICNNVLTQIERNEDFVFVMNEFWRVLHKDGALYIRVPVVPNDCAWQDPMDCRRFTTQSFTYMEDGHRRYRQYGINYGFKPWKMTVIEKREQMKLKLCPAK